MHTIKTTKQDNQHRVSGYLVRFTDSDNKDLHGEYFDKSTYFWETERPIKGIPIMIDHAFDSKFKGLPVGIVDFVKEDEVGIWIEGKLKERDEYLETLRHMRTKGVIDVDSTLLPKLATNIDKAVKSFFDTGQVQWSSGAHPQTVETKEDGHIKSWAFIEATAVMTPAEPRGTEIRSVKDALTLLDNILDSIPPSKATKEPIIEAKELDAGMNNNNVRQTPNPTKQEVAEMNPEELRAMIAEAVAEYMAEAKAEMMEDEEVRMSDGELDEVKEAMTEELESKMEDEEDVKSLDITTLTKAFTNAMAKQATSKQERQNGIRNAMKSYKATLQDDVIANADTKSQAGRTTNNKYEGISFRMGRSEDKPMSIGKALQSLYQQKVFGKSAKDVSYQIGSNSGFLLEHAVSDQFIEVLRDALILRQLGADMLTMDGQETLTLPKDQTEHTAYWVGEGTDIPQSDETVGGVTLYPKPLAARIIVPNKFLSNSRVDYENRVQEKATYQINRALEYAALFGAGGKTGSNTGMQPAGLTTLATITDRDVTATSLGANGAKPKLADIEDMIGRVEDANVVDDGTFGFALSPRAKRYFGNMKDADGNYILRSRASDGIDTNFLSYSYQESNLIPNNQTVGTNSDNTTLFFGKWSDLAIGMSNQVEFIIDPYSRSSKLQTVIIAHMYADVAVKHDESFEVLTGARV